MLYITRCNKMILQKYKISHVFQSIFAFFIFCSASCSFFDQITLVRNGTSEYCIIIPEEYEDVEKQAAVVLQKYIKEIAGIELPVESGSKDSREKEIFISIESKNPGYLINDGFSIKTKGKKLIITGGQDKGVLYGVYSFLEIFLDCRKYSSKVKIIPKKKKIIFPAVNITRVPVIKFRDTLYRDTNDPEYTAWHKLDHDQHGGHPDWGLWCHTFQRLVPPGKYFKNHPEYFSLVNGKRSPDTQLCLTNPDVLKIVVNNLKKEINDNPGALYWSVSQNDTYGNCECENCKKIDDHEGSPMGSLLTFINEVAGFFPERIISTLAYQYSRPAPKTIRPADNVNIMLCSIECNRSMPISVDPSSASFRNDVKDWAGITRNILIWDYVIQFKNLVSPFPNLRVLQPNIRFFVKNFASAMFQQGNRETGGEFPELRAYLISKLLWNPDADAGGIMNDFLSGYYGKAGKILKEYINCMHDALEESGERLDIFGNPFQPVNGYLSPEKMKKYEILFEKAESAVSDKPDILERVKIARLPLEYAILEQGKKYGKNSMGLFYQTDEKKWKVKPEMKKRLIDFVDLCNKAGFTRLKEWSTTPDDYKTSMERVFNLSMKNHLAMEKKVTFLTSFSPKYPVGPGALTDGIKGGADWNCSWMGFEEENMEIVIDLEKSSVVKSIEADFLQDIKSWIFLPVNVTFSASEDGNSFGNTVEVGNIVPENKTGVIIEPFKAEFNNIKVRYVKVKAEGVKICPDWHIGAGGKAWIFVDEVIVN